MREWPPPQRSWVIAQTWRDLLFAHWPVADLVVPAPLQLDRWNGQAWIGVIPFRMTGVRPRGMVALPWISATPEINVRTYVTLGGRRGIYFFSLHATNPAAVAVARRFFHLPYFRAHMKVRNEGESVRYESRRGGAEFCGVYRPMGEVAQARAGTLEYWLTERYCFYSTDRSGWVIRGEVDHAAWPLQAAQASIDVNTMTAPFGIPLPDLAPVLHFSKRIDVVMWMPERLATPDGRG